MYERFFQLTADPFRQDHPDWGCAGLSDQENLVAANLISTQLAADVLLRSVAFAFEVIDKDERRKGSARRRDDKAPDFW
mgnify:CR=1 FL=1